MRGALLLAISVVLLVGACGSGDSEPAEAGEEPARAAASERSGAEPPPAIAPQPADPDPSAEPGAGSAGSAEANETAVAVVRAWTEALNAGDNEAAGALFAPDAFAVQGGRRIPLPDLAAATRFTASLPCSGVIIDLTASDDVVTAVFELGHRATSQCDAPPGTLAAAAFLVEDGSIRGWRTVPVPGGGSDSNSAA